MGNFTRFCTLVCFGFIFVGCVSFSRELDGSVLIVPTPFVLSHEEQIIKERGVGLYRLLPKNETRSRHGTALWNKPEFSVMFWANPPTLLGLLVEVPPVAYGSYSGRRIQFKLPVDFEPSTHCFVVVAASGYVVETSVAPGDKRILLGLYPYSKKYPGRSGQGPSADITGTAKGYSGTDLECDGVSDDFIHMHAPSVGW